MGRATIARSLRGKPKGGFVADPKEWEAAKKGQSFQHIIRPEEEKKQLVIPDRHIVTLDEIAQGAK